MYKRNVLLDRYLKYSIVENVSLYQKTVFYIIYLW